MARPTPRRLRPTGPCYVCGDLVWPPRVAYLAEKWVRGDRVGETRRLVHPGPCYSTLATRLGRWKEAGL